MNIDIYIGIINYGYESCIFCEQHNDWYFIYVLNGFSLLLKVSSQYS